MPEATTHLVYPWVPTNRARRVLGLRYQMQHLGAEKRWPLDTLERCSPNTRELLSFAHYTATKGIALHEVVPIDEDITAGSEGAAEHVRQLQAIAVARSSKL
jgi:hypothetical protein